MRHSHAALLSESLGDLDERRFERLQVAVCCGRLLGDPGLEIADLLRDEGLSESPTVPGPGVRP